MSRLFGALLVCCFLPSVVPLFCYKCVVPAVSPIPRDCIHIPTFCPTGQGCLSSKATAQKGDIQVVLREKSCSLPAMCGVTGHKVVMGLNFTYTTECCESNLCNGSAVPRSVFSISTLLCLLLPLVFFI
ncbi:sperm acrosome membrane-associated protein 4-like [Tachysurus fulvidraco]|uniref:sperm acrosome membrane-associated protein 4-like n=1 Tax=Tachysurus fulvidraco TaxID=1234273 RepID=UPI001FF06049|nr:sperm acrosome membrane-associated protein 4-like [Tachysurus fulvidraco]